MVNHRSLVFRQKTKSESSSLLQSFRHFPYNKNPTRVLNTTHSNAVSHQLTLLTGGKNSRMRMNVQGRKRASLKSTRFLQKGRILSNRAVYTYTSM